MQDLWCPGRRGHPRRSQHTKAGPEGKSKEYGGQVRPLAQAKGLAYAPSSTPIRSSRSDKIQTSRLGTSALDLITFSPTDGACNIQVLYYIKRT